MFATTSNRQLGCRRLKHLDEPVGVGQRGRLVADEHDDALRRFAERDDAVAQPGRGIDEQHVERLEQLAEGADEAGVLNAAQASPC